MSDEILFTTTDPRGRTVICTKTQWDDHILVRHPEMAKYQAEVQTTIESPSLGIFQDVKHTNRHIYYRRDPGGRLYFKVIVEFDADDSGMVRTAFRTPSPKAGEKLLWLS